MGEIQHHAIVVTGYSVDVDVAHARALKIYGEAFADDPYYTGEDAQRLVGPIVDGLTNGYRSFTLHPDGSKEGWKTSDEIEIARRKFIKWLRHDGGHSWVAVGFGERLETESYR